MSYLGTPVSWGMPDRFAHWRTGQEAAAERTLEALDSGDAGLSAPTGSGKTLLYMLQHDLLSSSRTVVLTSTKALEQQLVDEFASVGLRVVHGRANYRCRDSGNCDQGRMRRCRWQGAGQCPYMNARKEFLGSARGCTNYSYALAAAVHSPGGIGRCGLLVVDEAHDALREISEALKVEVPMRGAVSHRQDGEIPDLPYWRSWAAAQLPQLEKEAKMTSLGISARLLAESWLRKLLVLRSMGDDWVVDMNDSAWEFNPVWPAEHARALLYRFADKVLFVSATLRPKTLALLGAPKAEFVEVASTFDPERAPVHLIPSGFVNFRMNPTQVSYWLSRIDQMIRPRVDRKGLIHSVSYERARLIKQRSDFGHLMILPRPAETAEEIRKFIAMGRPGILISPAIMTGYNFLGKAAEWQILSKAPFSDKRSRPLLTKRRRTMDPDYESNEVVQKIVQLAGRIVRSEEDQGETLVADDTVGCLIDTKRELFPVAFLDRVRRSDMLPAPLPAL